MLKLTATTVPHLVSEGSVGRFYSRDAGGCTPYALGIVVSMPPKLCVVSFKYARHILMGIAASTSGTR